MCKISSMQYLDFLYAKYILNKKNNNVKFLCKIYNNLFPICNIYFSFMQTIFFKC